MKALITGSSGFVGRYLKAELANYGYEVYGLDIKGTDYIADILDKDLLADIIRTIEPDCIFHLAGQASVGLSWKDPQLTFNLNVNGTLNLLEAVRNLQKNVRTLIIGSSDSYGFVLPELCPITEDTPSNPMNPYGVAKLSQEKMVLVYQKAYNLDIVLTRSFNHTGPGQAQGFVIPDFAAQIARIEQGAAPVIKVGNLEVKRDFSDVRDVVRAYRLLIEKGKTAEIYNVGSGRAYLISDLLNQLIAYSPIDIQVKRDPLKMRPVELKIIQSNINKLHQDTGFTPSYEIGQTLLDTLNYSRNFREY